MTGPLQLIIEKLYDVFSLYRGNPHMAGSPVYDDELEEWNKALFAKPLRLLTADDLSRFAGKSITTWGDENDYRHFLPRILELTAAYDSPYEIWIAFHKLDYVGWHRWPAAEQELIREYQLALWNNLLQDESSKAEGFFMSYFSALAHYYPRFTELITSWQNTRTKASALHLANLIYYERHCLFDKGIISGFHNQQENVAELTAWLLSAEMRNWLSAAFFEFEQEEFAERLSWAEQNLRAEYRAAYHKKSLG
jgi:hypothetical protein